MKGGFKNSPMVAAGVLGPSKDACGSQIMKSKKAAAIVSPYRMGLLSPARKDIVEGRVS
jgi:hypothetical protein